MVGCGIANGQLGIAAWLRSILLLLRADCLVTCSTEVIGASMDMETKLFPIEALREFSTRVFRHFGCPREDAEQASDVLSCADLRGIDSHGIARLHSYFELLSDGRINSEPKVEIVRSTLSTATVDGDNGLGLVVGAKANVIAMDLAE
jgi:L-2-hydroxycarboxylate dehydrogenase (NAD+)